jgi:putative membrane protein
LRHDGSWRPADAPGAPVSTIVRLGIVWGANAVALISASRLFEGVVFDPEWRVVTAALVFGAVNSLVKPIIRKLALPLVFLTFGIALYFINLLTVWLTSVISSGFEIDTYDGVARTALLLWAVNLVIGWIYGFHDRHEADHR